jgi:hypothetical protein
MIKENIASLIGVSFLNQPLGCNDLLQRWSSPMYNHTQVVGLEDETRKVKDWLFEADGGIRAVGVIGLGGLGKTTIA